MPTFEAYLERLARCRTTADVRDLYVAEMAWEGYDNVVFGGLTAPGSIDLRWAVVPDGFGDSYFSMAMHRSDPVLHHVDRARDGFYWNDLTSRSALSSDARRVMDLCRELGVSDGLTIPLRGPHGGCDLFSLSQRVPAPVDRGRTAIVKAKTYQAWLRYWEIVAAAADMSVEDAQAKLTTGVAFDITTDGDETLCGGPGQLTRRLCRTLVLVEIAARRQTVGLLTLSTRLAAGLAGAEIRELSQRGLVADTADDQRWIYYLAPTLLGAMHLKACDHATGARRLVRDRDVPAGERPSP